MEAPPQAIASALDGNTLEALELLQAIVEREPLNWKARHDLGVLALSQGEIPAAVEAFDQAAKQGGDDPHVRATLAVMAHVAGNRAGAIEGLQALASAPCPYAWQNLAALLWAAGRQIETAKAVARFKEAAPGVTLDYQRAVVRTIAEAPDGRSFEVNLKPDGGVVFRRAAGRPGVVALGPEAVQPILQIPGSISIACAACQTRLTVPPELAGSPVACPQCKGTTDVPEDPRPKEIRSLRSLLRKAEIAAELRPLVEPFAARLEETGDLKVADIRLWAKGKDLFLERVTPSGVEPGVALSEIEEFEYRAGETSAGRRILAALAGVLLVSSVVARAHSFALMAVFLGAFALVLPFFLLNRPRRGFSIRTRIGGDGFMATAQAPGARQALARFHLEMLALSVVVKAILMQKQSR